MKYLLAISGLTLIVTFGYQLTDRLSSDTIAMIIGFVLAIMVIVPAGVIYFVGIMRYSQSVQREAHQQHYIAPEPSRLMEPQEPPTIIIVRDSKMDWKLIDEKRSQRQIEAK